MATIAAAGPSDAATVRALLAQLHPETAGRTTLPAVRQESRTLLARAGDVAVGVLVATFVDYGTESYGMIEELVIDEGHRGRGYGKLLLSECRRWFTAMDIDVVFVSALPDAAEFYRANGFRPCIGPWLYAASR